MEVLRGSPCRHSCCKFSSQLVLSSERWCFALAVIAKDFRARLLMLEKMDSQLQKKKLTNCLSKFSLSHDVHHKCHTLFPVKRAGGKKSDRRRVWHFMERERLPRKRRGPEPRSVVDFTNKNNTSSSIVASHPSVHPPPTKVRSHFGAGCAVQSEESRRVRGTVTL